MFERSITTSSLASPSSLYFICIRSSSFSSHSRCHCYWLPSSVRHRGWHSPSTGYEPEGAPLGPVPLPALPTGPWMPIAVPVPSAVGGVGGTSSPALECRPRAAKPPPPGVDASCRVGRCLFLRSYSYRFSIFYSSCFCCGCHCHDHVWPQGTASSKHFGWTSRSLCGTVWWAFSSF